MSPTDGFVHRREDGLYDASYHGRELGTFDTEQAALNAVLEVTEGRRIWLTGYGVEHRQLS